MSSGQKPAKDKVSVITALPSPTNKKQVQSFIGMINYLTTFSPRLSELAEPKRELLKDKVPFNWGSGHQQASTQMKEFEWKNSKMAADTDQNFCYHFTVRYIPGITNQLVDCLSYNAWMAKHHQRGTKWNPTILDLQRRADSGRWYCLEGYLHCYSTQETSSYTSIHTWRTLRSW